VNAPLHLFPPRYISLMFVIPEDRRASLTYIVNTPDLSTIGELGGVHIAGGTDLEEFSRSRFGAEIDLSAFCGADGTARLDVVDIELSHPGRYVIHARTDVAGVVRDVPLAATVHQSRDDDGAMLLRIRADATVYARDWLPVRLAERLPTGPIALVMDWTFRFA
jgi:hypothetical protein